MDRNVFLFTENISVPIIPMAWLAAHGALFFLAAVCSGSLGILHNALQYSLYLCFNNKLIHAQTALPFQFPHGYCAAAGGSVSVTGMG